MTIQEAIAYITAHTWSQKRIGLARAKELLRRLGDPQKSLRFVHVAGSNGKGSTCAMLERILREAGYRTGFFPSPYIEDFRERIQVCGQMIPAEALCEITDLVRQEADAMEDHPSQFELVTAIGMVWFLRRKCDLVVLEVGLGGEYDATNVIDPPEVAVITHIGLEHTEYLGDTLEKIARTKGGIIKTGSDVVLYENPPEVMETIREICLAKKCPLHVAHASRIRLREATLDGQVFVLGPEECAEKDRRAEKDSEKGAESGAGVGSDACGVYRLALPGSYQLHNAVTVLTTVEVLRRRGFRIPQEAVAAGLAKVRWPARFEVLSREPLFILDGGHNPQCAEALAESIETCLGVTGEKSAQSIRVDSGADGANAADRGVREITPGDEYRKVIFLLGVLAEKDYAEILRILGPYADFFYCVTPDSPRALPADRLAAYLREAGYGARACASVEEGIRGSLLAALAGQPVIAFGSLYMAGEIRRVFPRLCKEAQRRIIRERREAMTKEERAGASEKICKHLETLFSGAAYQGVWTLFSYRAMPEEADLTAFNRLLEEQGVRMAYPVALAGGRMLAAVPQGQDAWRAGWLDIQEPDPERSEILEPSAIDAVLVPCVAFDRRGNRCGHGAGYYDRFLEKCRSDARLVMIAYSAQELRQVVTEKTDMQIPCIVTEEGILNAGNVDNRL